jgi:transposase
MKNFLSPGEVGILQEAHHAAREKRKADRIKTILLLNEGYPYPEIARILLLDDSTTRQYFKEYQALGLDGLVEDNYSGSESFLTTNEQQELTLYLKNHTHHSAKEVVSYINKTYGKRYSIEGMTHLLHQLGFVYKKTKIIPGKLDPSKQEEFKKQYQTLKTSLNPGDSIYFLDACHPHHNNEPSYGWIYKGEERWIKTNTGRKRININGALNLGNNQNGNDNGPTIITRLEETINAEAMILLIKNIEQNQPEGEIYLILDNARYNHALIVKDYIQKSGRIHLVFLPSYSPNLNIIERLWLFLHQKILYDKYYETFPEFKTAVENFLQSIQQYQGELKSRLTDSFQVIPA